MTNSCRLHRILNWITDSNLCGCSKYPIFLIFCFNFNSRCNNSTTTTVKLIVWIKFLVSFWAMLSYSITFSQKKSPIWSIDIFNSLLLTPCSSMKFLVRHIGLHGCWKIFMIWLINVIWICWTLNPNSSMFRKNRSKKLNSTIIK